MLQRPLPQLDRQQPGKIALNLSLRNLRPLSPGYQNSASADCLQRLQLLCRDIPPVPHWILRDCQALVAGDFSVEFRAKRAWEAGFWAGLTLQGRVRTLRASPSFPVRPKVYVILRAPGLEAPTRVSNASDFYRIAGRLEGSNVMCDSFQSLSESNVYCEGAGFRLPSQHQWR